MHKNQQTAAGLRLSLAAYDSDSVERWRITGKDFDLESRYLSGEYENSVDLKLTGAYAIDSKSAVRAMYIFGHRKTDDWVYDGVGPQTITGMIGTNEVPPSYSVSVFGVSYIYRFH